MYKLIIVDDEPATRHGLRVCVDWAAYGVEIAGEADGGEAGLRLAERVRPDIVLTDVKMPGMDGIEMVRRLRQSFERLSVIFVSGYDDVDYLKQAMKYAAVDYILKPVQLDELLQVVRKVVDMSNREADRQALWTEMNAKLRESMPLLRERFFAQLLAGEAEGDLQALENRIDFLDLSLPLKADYCALVVSMDNREAILRQIGRKEAELVSFSVLNICEEIVRDRLSGYAVEHRAGEYVILLRLSGDEEQEAIFPLVTQLKEQLSAFMERFIRTSLTVGVGHRVDQLRDVPYSYFTAMEAVRQKLFLGTNQIITVDDMETGQNIDLRHIHARVNALPSLLKSGMEEKALAFLDSLFEELAACRGMTRHHCRIVALQVLTGASHFLIEYGMASAGIERRERELWEVLFQLETIQDMREALGDYLLQVCRAVGERRDRKTHEVIERIKTVVLERYHENLTIGDIATQVFFSSTYICLLFKQETGETINDFITKTRMDKAKELLVDTSYKLHEICALIGYAEPSYFSKQFKKTVGMSPSEYRDIYAER